MSTNNKDQIDLRFFKGEVTFENRSTTKVVVDCSQIIAIEKNTIEETGEEIIVTTQGGTVRLPCSSESVWFSEEESTKTYELILEKWILYKMDKTT